MIGALRSSDWYNKAVRVKLPTDKELRSKVYDAREKNKPKDGKAVKEPKSPKVANTKVANTADKKVKDTTKNIKTPKFTKPKKLSEAVIADKTSAQSIMSPDKFTSIMLAIDSANGNIDSISENVSKIISKVTPRDLTKYHTICEEQLAFAERKGKQESAALWEMISIEFSNSL